MIFHFDLGFLFDFWIAWLFVQEHSETTPPLWLTTADTGGGSAGTLETFPASKNATKTTATARSNGNLSQHF